MAKNRKSVKFEDREISINEIALKEILFTAASVGFLPMRQEYDLSDKFKDKKIYEIILAVTSDITVEEMVNFSPSEIKQLYDVFLEVNSIALLVVKNMGLAEMVKQIKDQITASFISDSIKGYLDDSGKGKDQDHAEDDIKKTEKDNH